MALKQRKIIQLELTSDWEVRKVSCKYRANFDGRNLRLIRGDKIVRVFPAQSGRPGTTALDQNKKDVGPIPEGNYSFRPKEADCTKNWISTKLRNLMADWGVCRIPIEPEKETETFGRKGFKIHGGKDPGSAGCIDLGSRDKEFVDFVTLAEKLEGCEKIPLDVHYPELDNITPPWENMPQSRPGGMDGNPNTPF